MFTNELKNGTRIKLRNGWFGTLKDNKKGNIRLSEVEGIVTETGSVYSHDIMFYQAKDGEFYMVDHTPAQLKCRDMNRKLFGD